MGASSAFLAAALVAAGTAACAWLLVPDREALRPPGGLRGPERTAGPRHALHAPSGGATFSHGGGAEARPSRAASAPPTSAPAPVGAAREPSQAARSRPQRSAVFARAGVPSPRQGARAATPSRAAPVAASGSAAQATGRLLLRVQDEAQPARPAFAVRVTPLEPPGDAWERPALSLPSRDGGHTLELAAGTYRIRVSAPGRVALPPTQVDVHAGAEVELDLTLRSAVSLRGAVRRPPELVAQAGVVVLDVRFQPLPGAADVPERWEQRPSLGPQGAFELRDLRPGLYAVRAGVADDPAWRSAWAQCEVSAQAGQSAALELSLERLVPSLRGVVRDLYRAPLEGVEVRVGHERALTDREGAFAVYGLSASVELLELKKPGFATQRHMLALDDAAAVCEFECHPLAEVRGSVSDGLPGGRVVLLEDLGEGRFSSRAQLTDATGQFAFEELAPGDYVLLAGERVDADDAAAGTRLRVEPGQRYTVAPLDPS